jgi:hypothetical protein
MKKPVNIGVIGGSACTSSCARIAYTLGKLIAREGWILICGGRGGVMRAAAKGASEHKGIVVGILPGVNKQEANPYVNVAIPTGIGYVRNFLIVRSSDYLIALEGKYGTLSEISFAFNDNKKVVGINTWKIPGIVPVATAQAAMAKIKSWIKDDET